MNVQLPSLSKTVSQEQSKATSAEVEYIKNEKGCTDGGRRKALLLSAESSSSLHLSPALRELAASLVDWWVLPAQCSLA